MRRFPTLFLIGLLFVPEGAWAQGVPLGPEFRVNTYTTNFQRSPAVASDSSGNFVVVWNGLSSQDTSGGVFGQRYASSGTSLGPQFRINTFTTSIQDYPAVASDSSGNFVVVWRSHNQESSNTFGVFGQRYASTGAPLGPEFRVNTFTPNSQEFPAVASDASGNFVAVWRSQNQDGSFEGIYGQRYANTGAPLGAEFRVNTYTSFNQRLPAVASDASGNFVVVWRSGQDGSGYAVIGQRFASSGAPLGPEFRVNTYTPSTQSFPAVAADTAGNFVVVWSSYNQDGSLYGVFGQRYASSGAPLGPEFPVNTFAPRSQQNPVLASDSSGNFVVVWDSYDQDGSLYGVFGQRYANSGAPLGGEFRVNTYTTGNQGQFFAGPSVAADVSGNFVVIWGSDGQYGSAFGVFGQRYSQILPVDLIHFLVE